MGRAFPPRCSRTRTCHVPGVATGPSSPAARSYRAETVVGCPTSWPSPPTRAVFRDRRRLRPILFRACRWSATIGQRAEAAQWRLRSGRPSSGFGQGAGVKAASLQRLDHMRWWRAVTVIGGWSWTAAARCPRNADAGACRLGPSVERSRSPGSRPPVQCTGSGGFGGFGFQFQPCHVRPRPSTL